jgi:hypothetical protein
MRLFILGSLFAICLGIAGPAHACGPEVLIQFAEESPDRFRITFVRGAKLRLVSLDIKLNGSAAGAIFDDYDGLAMQGPQPNASGITIRSIKYRASGQETVTLAFDGFVEGELTGATAVAELVSTTGRRISVSGRFDKLNQARLGERACV